MLDTLICDVDVFDGTGAAPFKADVALQGGRVAAVLPANERERPAAAVVVRGTGHALAPGFIDVHSHDDLALLETPELLPKLSQGVTTVVVGNCGISAAPVRLAGALPDPLNLLGPAQAFRFGTFEAYVREIERARPAVNVAALVGHTSLRQNALGELDRAATPVQLECMRAELAEALDHGALGLSTGLAYQSAIHAPPEEVLALVEMLCAARGVYATHLRSESAEISAALEEAFTIAHSAGVTLQVSHLKCAGVENYGRSAEVLTQIERAALSHPVGCDCYPYTASASTLDLRQVDERVPVLITWSEPHPELGGLKLQDIADRWQLDLLEAARRLQPAGAVYHCMDEADVSRILQHPSSVIGSDGLPCDPRPHPRLWGAFPRVLGHYVRERRLLTLAEAIHKMTGKSAARFNLQGRGSIAPQAFADLVLFDPLTVADASTFEAPCQAAHGIAAVWVNGELSYRSGSATGARAGRFLARA